MTTPRETLEDFMARKSSPSFKPYRVPKPNVTLPKLGASHSGLVREYQYTIGQDLRTIREPVTLEEFIARKSVPNQKLAPLPKPPGVRPPSAKQIAAEIWAWDQMAKRYARERATATA